jgi:hypothetical protein
MKAILYPLALFSALICAAVVEAADDASKPVGAPSTPASGAPAAQPQTPPTRVRGTVEKLNNDVLTVKTREGSTADIKLADNWGVLGVTKAKLTDIKPDTFVGIAAKQNKDGLLQALEVLIFPENMKGFGEGHYPWDLQPESTMTNATVTNTVKNVKGEVLTLRYKDGEKQITVPKSAPIVTFAPAEKSAVKPGAHVFITAMRQPDGSLGAQRVAVGLNGVKPPM